MIRRISPQRYVALLIGLGVAGSLAYSTSFAMKFAGVLVGFGVGLAVYQPPEPDPAKWPYQYRFTPQIQRMNAAIVVWLSAQPLWRQRVWCGAQIGLVVAIMSIVAALPNPALERRAAAQAAARSALDRAGFLNARLDKGFGVRAMGLCKVGQIRNRGRAFGWRTSLAKGIICIPEDGRPMRILREYDSPSSPILPGAITVELQPAR